MKPTPVILVGVTAWVATTASVGTRSDMSAMSMSMPRSGVSRRRMTTVSSPVDTRHPIDASTSTNRASPCTELAAEAAHAHRSADHRRRGERVAGRRRVGLDGERRRLGSSPGLTRTRSPGHVDVGGAERRHHRGVISRYDADTDGVDSQRCRPPGMYGPISISAVMYWLDTSPRHHHGVGAAQRAGDGDRQVPPLLARLDGGAEGDERVVERCHRAPPQRRIAVDRERPAAERGERGDEPRRRAGEPGRQVDRLPAGARRRCRRCRRLRTPPCSTRIRRRSRALEAVEHRGRVVAAARRPMISLVPSTSAAQTSARLAMLFDGGHVDVGDDGTLGADDRIRRPSSAAVTTTLGPTAGTRGRSARRGTGRPVAWSTSTTATPRLLSTMWTTSKLAMLTPSSAASVNTSAAAPGAVGDRDADLGQLLGWTTRLGRFVRALAGLLQPVEQGVAVVGVDDPRAPRSARSISPSSAPTIAGRFSAQMSSQMPGWPLAMRVMSRKPPAASRSSAACSSARSLARPISVAAVRCGTWLTTATTWSWRSGPSATTSAPSDGDDARDLGERGVVGVARPA